jgi:hypothetical protein
VGRYAGTQVRRYLGEVPCSVRESVAVAVAYETRERGAKILARREETRAKSEVRCGEGGARNSLLGGDKGFREVPLHGHNAGEYLG